MTSFAMNELLSLKAQCGDGNWQKDFCNLFNFVVLLFVSSDIHCYKTNMMKYYCNASNLYQYTLCSACFQTLQNEEKRNLELGGHVGFDSLPDQLVSKSVAQGFSFNILCVGMSEASSSS